MSLREPSPARRAEPDADHPRLKKYLGPYDGVAILLVVSIGAGIFATPQKIAAHHESFPPILLYWLLIGALVYIAGLIWAELGTRLPVTGGEYVYLRRCFGPWVGFLFGWKSFVLTGPSTRAALAIVSADYLGYFVRLDERSHTALAIAILVLMAAVNYIGIDWTARFQRFSAFVKVGGLMALVGTGWVMLGFTGGLLRTSSPPTSDLGPWGNAAITILLVFFAYTGWGRVGYVAGEMKNPRRALPVAMLVGIGALMILYGSVNVLYHQVLGIEGVRRSSFLVSDTAVRLVGPIGAALAAAMVVISTTGSMSVSIMSCSRLYYAMARDRLFFRFFDHIHPRFRTPSRAIAAHGAAAILMLLLRRSFTELVTSAVFVNMAFDLLKTLSLFKLRRQAVGEPGCYRVPFYPWLPGLFLIALFGILIIRVIFDWERAWFDLLVLAVGIPAARAWMKWRTFVEPRR